MVFAALSLASGIAKLAGSAGQAASLVSPSNKKDPERAANARAATVKALAGDLNAAQELYLGAGHVAGSGSATAYGKQQFEMGWQQVVNQRPDIANQVLGRTAPPPGPSGVSPSITDRLQAEAQKLLQDGREAAAVAAGRVLLGTKVAVQEEINPSGNYTVMPMDKKQLLMVGGALLVAMGAVYYFASR